MDNKFDRSKCPQCNSDAIFAIDTVESIDSVVVTIECKDCNYIFWEVYTYSKTIDNNNKTINEEK